MKDFTIDDLAKDLAKEFSSRGIEIPPRKIKTILRGHFNLIDEIMLRQGHDNMVIYNGEVTAIFKPYPKDNKSFDSKYLTQREFSKSKKKLSKRARQYAWKYSTSQKSPEELDLELEIQP